MPFESDFLELMNDTVVVSHRSAHSNYGVQTFSTLSSTYRARVVEAVGEHRDALGQNVKVTAIAWIASTGDNTIRDDDKVTLPNGTSPPILRISAYPDEVGLHHYKVLFG